MTAKTRNGLIIAGAIITLGTLGFFIWKGSKKKSIDSTEPESESAESNRSNTSDSGSAVQDAPIPPEKTPTPESILLKSYKDVKASLGARLKNYGTYSTLITSSKELGVPDPVGGGSAYLVVNKEGIWRLFYIAKGKKVADRQMVAKGRYYEGGKRIIVGWGKNQDLIVEGDSLGNNLYKVMTT